MFDAFIGMIYNVLSRELFTGLIDKSYLMSFFVNYGIGYQGNDDFVRKNYGGNCLIIMGGVRCFFVCLIRIVLVLE